MMSRPTQSIHQWRQPNFFVVGAPRSGTTSLFDYLRLHPNLFLPYKEPDHFGYDLDMPRMFRSTDEYKTALSCDHASMSGECSPWYLYSSTAALEIYSFNPHAKIIISLRNPCEMVHSLFCYRRHTGIERTAFSPLDAFEREERYLASMEPTTPINPMFVYFTAAKYYAQVKRYYEVFGRNNVHIINFDDLRCKPEETCNNLVIFLGIGPSSHGSLKHLNKTGHFRSERLQRYVDNLPAEVRNVARKIPTRIRRNAYWAFYRFNTTHAPTSMDPQLRRRLNAFYRDDVERLSALIRRDLTHWTAD